LPRTRRPSGSGPDALRQGPPFKDGVAGLDRSQFQANFNSSKLGNPGDKFKTTQFVTTDLSFPEKDASKVAQVTGVDGVGRGLTLNALTISGTVPKRITQSSVKPSTSASIFHGMNRDSTCFTSARAAESMLLMP